MSNAQVYKSRSPARARGFGAPPLEDANKFAGLPSSEDEDNPEHGTHGTAGHESERGKPVESCRLLLHSIEREVDYESSVH